MLWVLCRLGNLCHRRLIAIICVAGIDVLAWHSASLLERLSDHSLKSIYALDLMTKGGKKCSLRTGSWAIMDWN